MHPDKPTILVSGDSAIGFSGMEMETVCRLGLPVFETVHALPCADTWRQQEEIQLQPAE